MALLSNIAGTEQVVLTNINACINTVNLFGGGAVGKIATKSSANDFDIFYAENAFNQKSTTSITIGTGNKDFDIGGSQWDDDFNFRVKAYSIGSSGNYMEGTISALTTGYGVKTWRMVVDTFVGSGTFTDWQFQVLNYVPTPITHTSTVLTPGEILSSFTQIGCSVSGANLNLYLYGKRVTIDGYITFSTSSTTPTLRLNLNANYNRDTTVQTTEGYYPFTLFNSTDVLITAGFIEQYDNVINFIRPVTYISGKTYSISFQISFNID